MSNDFLHVKPAATAKHGGGGRARGPLRQTIPRPRRITREQEEDTRLLMDMNENDDSGVSPRKKKMASSACRNMHLRDVITYINFLGVIGLAIALGILASRAPSDGGLTSKVAAPVPARGGEKRITFTLTPQFSISTSEVRPEHVREGRVHYEVCCSLPPTGGREQQYICNDFTRFSGSLDQDGKRFSVKVVDTSIVGSVCHLLIDSEG